jgi:hypothetical protein
MPEDLLKPEPDGKIELDEIDDLADDAAGWLGGNQVSVIKADADGLSAQVNQLAIETFKSPGLQAAFTEPLTASDEDFSQDDAQKQMTNIKDAVSGVLAQQNSADMAYNARTFLAGVYGVMPDPAKPADFSFEVFSRLAQGQSLDGLGLDADAEAKAREIWNSFLAIDGDGVMSRVSAVMEKRNVGPVDGLLATQYLTPLAPSGAYAPVIWPKSSDKVSVIQDVATRLQNGDSIAAILQAGPTLAQPGTGLHLSPPVAGSCIGLGVGAYAKGILPHT